MNTTLKEFLDEEYKDKNYIFVNVDIVRHIPRVDNNSVLSSVHVDSGGVVVLMGERKLGNVQMHIIIDDFPEIIGYVLEVDGEAKNELNTLREKISDKKLHTDIQFYRITNKRPYYVIFCNIKVEHSQNSFENMFTIGFDGMIKNHRIKDVSLFEFTSKKNVLNIHTTKERKYNKAFLEICDACEPYAESTNLTWNTSYYVQREEIKFKEVLSPIKCLLLTVNGNWIRFHTVRSITITEHEHCVMIDVKGERIYLENVSDIKFEVIL